MENEGSLRSFYSKLFRVWFVLMNRWFCAVRASGTGSKGNPQRSAAPPLILPPLKIPLLKLPAVFVG